MRAILAVIALIALLSIPLIWLAVDSLLPEGEERAEPDGDYTGGAVDSGARIEMQVLRDQITALQEQVAALEANMREMEIEAAQRRAALPSGPEGEAIFGPDDAGELPDDGENLIQDQYAQVVLIANRRQVNGALKVAGPRFLEQFLGRPRDRLSDRCEPMTHPKLRGMLVTDTAGPIRVTMLQPALDSIRRVFENVRATDQDLYDRINTAGSLCVRQIRGTRGRTSTHSFGLAVDLNIDGRLDTLGDGRTQLGLTILADFFKEEGWVWGAGYSREDSMHFEVSRQKLEEWREEGKI